MSRFEPDEYIDDRYKKMDERLQVRARAQHAGSGCTFKQATHWHHLQRQLGHAAQPDVMSTAGITVVSSACSQVTVLNVHCAAGRPQAPQQADDSSRKGVLIAQLNFIRSKLHDCSA